MLIKNNIVNRVNKVMVVRSSGAGSVVGYNYMDNGFIENAQSWVEVGLNGSHMVGSHHILFEGNEIAQLRFRQYPRKRDRDDHFSQSPHRTTPRLSWDGERARRWPDVRIVVALVHRQCHR